MEALYVLKMFPEPKLNPETVNLIRNENLAKNQSSAWLTFPRRRFAFGQSGRKKATNSTPESVVRFRKLSKFHTDFFVIFLLCSSCLNFWGRRLAYFTRGC